MVENKTVLTSKEFAKLPIFSLDADNIVIYNGEFQQDLSDVAYSGTLKITDENHNDKPIHFVHISDKVGDDFSIFMLDISAKKPVELIVSFVCLANCDLKSKVMVRLKKGATLNHLQSIYVEKGASLHRSFVIDIDEDATYKNLFFQKNYGLVENCVELNSVGNGAQIVLRGLYTALENSKNNFSIKDIHKANKTSSDILFKGIVEGNSVVDFDIVSEAKRDIIDSTLSQYHRVLLLSDSAFVKSRPDMKIYSENVQANHGFTVSNLNEDEFFFLKNRGLSSDDAIEVLKRSFGSEIGNKVLEQNLKLELLKNLF